MDIVRIKLLKPNSFWFLNDLHLGPGNELSQPFDLDKADSKTKEKILKAQNDFGIIKVVRQVENKAPLLNINKDSSKRFELPKTGLTVVKLTEVKKEAAPPRPPAQEEIPEVTSITVEPEPEEEEVLEDPSEEDYDNARALLARNGNTIKKIARSIEDRLFALACLKIEAEGKNREGILEVLQETLKRTSK